MCLLQPGIRSCSCGLGCACGARRGIGNLGDYSAAVFITATILIWKGYFEQALAEGQEQARLGREAAETQTLAGGLWVQGFAERCLGRLEKAGHVWRLDKGWAISLI